MRRSVDIGLNLLVEKFSQAIVECSDQKFVLAGYSQGAWVIKLFLLWLSDKAESLRDRVSVLQYGDPTLYRFDHILYPRRAGRFAGGLAGPMTTPSWVDKGRSYCLHSDPICHGDPASFVWCVSVGWDNRCAHLRYQEVMQEAARWLAGLFRGRTPPAPPSPPVPPGEVTVSGLYIRGEEGDPTDELGCGEPFQFYYSLTSSFTRDTQASVSVRAFDREWLPVNTGRVTLHPGLSNFYTPAEVPMDAQGAYTWVIQVEYPGGREREQRVVTISGSCH
jgi:hypothetical protein